MNRAPPRAALHEHLPVHITEQEFQRFQTLIERETGIHLPNGKKDLLVARLARRLRALGLDSYSRYWEHVAGGQNQAERQQMVDLVCTNETRFFREPKHFEFLEQVALPELSRRASQGRRQKSVRIWSAGCSTGEEPYSLAMTLMRRFPPGSGWQLSVVASDLSTRALEAAQRACYTAERASEIPAEFARMFVISSPDAGDGCTRTVVPAVRQLVGFSRANLTQDESAIPGLFDLVFCRNVLIYFQPETRRRVVARLLAKLQPEGYLVLGHAESLLGVIDGIRMVGPTIYSRTAGGRLA